MQVVYFIFVSFERVLRYIQIIPQLFDFRRMLQEECIHFDCTASQCFPEKEMPHTGPLWGKQRSVYHLRMSSLTIREKTGIPGKPCCAGYEQCEWCNLSKNCKSIQWFLA